MATCLLRLTVHDPEIVATLDALRAARKQSAFVVAALRHFLRTEEGSAQLAAFLGSQPIQKKPPEPKEAKLPKPEQKPDRKVSKTNLDDIFR
jgi:hypothetical protein